MTVHVLLMCINNYIFIRMNIFVTDINLWPATLKILMLVV